MCFDGMHGVAGPYAHALFGTELGLSTSSLHNCIPSETFGGGHPDPNLVYAAELVAKADADGDGRAGRRQGGDHALALVTVACTKYRRDVDHGHEDGDEVGVAVHDLHHERLKKSRLARSGGPEDQQQESCPLQY